MPGSLTHTFTSRMGGVPGTVALPAVRDLFNFQLVQAQDLYHIDGQTLDSSGNALAGCTVHLYKTIDDTPQLATVSDASGNYRFTVSNAYTYYCVAYKAGSPDVAGTTVNTLVGVL